MGYRIQSTSHAKQRLKKRQDIGNKNQREKLLFKVKQYGLVAENFIGDFKKFLKGKQRKPNTQIKVYEDFIYIIGNKRLITSYEVPARFLPTKKWMKKTYNGLSLYETLLDYLKEEEFEIIVITKDSSGYTVGLVINDVFENYGIGTTENKAVNNAIKTYLNRIIK